MLEYTLCYTGEAIIFYQLLQDFTNCSSFPLFVAIFKE
jgi:hypothetical protein